MALLLFAVQLAVGGLVLGLLWRRADLLKAAAIALSVALAVELLARATGSPSPVGATLAALHGARWLYLVGGLATVPGCYLVIMAGHAERAGNLQKARHDVRRGGFFMAAGAVTQTLSEVVSLVIAGWSSPLAFTLSASATTTLAAGCAGLLAGLSGKPRPTGYLAAALVVVGALAWLASR